MANIFGVFSPPMVFAKKYLPEKRIDEDLKRPLEKPQHYDILDGYLAAHKLNPGVVSRKEIIDLALMVAVPVSEIVRTAISVFIFQVARDPQVLAKVQEELDEFFADKDTIPSWDVLSTKLPYFDACIKETNRIHPPTGLMPERIVPEGGAVICGHLVPAGTAVACNPWVIHRHKPTFGDDAENFRPERWLETSKEQRLIMEKYLCTFGYGSRSCLGMDMGLFEMYKVAATLFSRYKVRKYADSIPSIVLRVLIRFRADNTREAGPRYADHGGTDHQC